jgi:hypothetical protein
MKKLEGKINKFEVAYQEDILSLRDMKQLPFRYTRAAHTLLILTSRTRIFTSMRVTTLSFFLVNMEFV